MHRSRAVLLLLLIIGIAPMFADFQAGKRAFEKGDFATALSEWLPLAEKGDTESQRRVGELYEKGQGVVSSKALALNWYRRAAQEGSAKALAELGWLCPHEAEGAQLLLRAEGALLRLADVDDAEAQMMVGNIWSQKYQTQRRAKGLPIVSVLPDKDQAEVGAQKQAAEGMWRRAAAQGNYAAHMVLALECTGIGGAGCAEELKWLTSAALSGDVVAEEALGNYYTDDGTNPWGLRPEVPGFAKSNPEAIKWLRKAAEQGDHWAPMLLGDMYSEDRKGVKRDVVEAIIWYRKAAESTYSDEFDVRNAGIHSAERLAGYFSQDSGALRNEEEANKWYTKAAEWGSVSSQRYLGTRSKSVYWLRRAAAQGDATSQLELGRTFLSGVGVTQDYVQAYLWFNLAASKSSHFWDPDFDAAGGEIEAARQRDTLAKRMTAEQVAEAQNLSRVWDFEPEHPGPPPFTLEGPCMAGPLPKASGGR